MTLVLPFGVDQINPLFSGSGNNQKSSMPCVFDNDAFERDFESALMRDWTSDISDYDMPAEVSPVKTPSGGNDLKRKSTLIDDDVAKEESQSKKPRFENDDLVPSLHSDLELSSSSGSSDLCSSTSSSSSSVSSSPFLDSSLDTNSTSPSSSSSSSSSSSEGGQDEDVTPEDDDYMPRRRGIQMWNSRQRWKDERKKVMKMSVTKLSEIEDPELCLLRSVLINNTIKKLHSDIKSERQAKLRHRQQRMDFFAERFPPLSSAMDSSENLSDFGEAGGGCSVVEQPKPNPANASDFYDDSSCDEIFGISEDFLRVTIPDRRASSPIPTSPANRRDTTETDSVGHQLMEGVTTSPVTTASVTCSLSCYNNSTSLPSCDTAVDSSSSPFYQRRTPLNNSQTVVSTTPAFPSATGSPPPPSLKRIMASVSTAASGGIQCATQYRTNRDLGCGGDSFPPRVPILDSVVYHSLLASLESS